MSYNSCKIVNYSRINSETGTGFILKRLVEGGPMTRAEVYAGSHYDYRPGFHSSIWAKILDDVLIDCDGGRELVNMPYANAYANEDFKTLRAFGKHVAPVYHITDIGRGIYEDMIKRETAK